MKEVPLDFDIDHYLNPYIPYNKLHLLPKPISWFLGYRKNNRKAIGSLVVVWWSFIGAFVGMLVVEAVYMTHGLQSDGAPIVIASLVRPQFIALPQYTNIAIRAQQQFSNSTRLTHPCHSPAMPYSAKSSQLL
jgi:hypothetical protein